MHRRFLLTSALALLALLLAGPARALAHGEGPQQTVDGYTVTLVLPEKGFSTGHNPVSVTLWDWQGNTPETSVTLALLAFTPPAAGHGDHGAEDEHGAEDDHGSAEAADHGHAPADAHAATEPEADNHGAEDDHAATETEADDHDASDEGHDHSGEDALEGRALAAVPVALAPGHELGEFMGELAFDEAGTYTVSVVFTLDGEEHGAIFDVEVSQSRPRGLVLGGFALVNGLAIGAAAFLKWRSPAKPTRKPARPTSPAPTTTTPKE